MGRREDATSFALFRIGMGLSVLLTVGSVVASGLVDVLWIDAIHGGARDLGDGPWLVAWLGGPQPSVVWSLVVACLGSAALLTLGIGGRWIAALTLVTTANVLNLNNHAGGSYDELLTNGLWLTLLGNSAATLSVRAWRVHAAWWPEVQIVAAPRWLAAWQLVLMYCATGLQKLSAYWVPGGESSALYYILQQPTWHRTDMSALAYVFPLTQVATTTTWLWEVTAPLWLLAVWWAIRSDRSGLAGWVTRWRVRWGYLIVGVIMHLVIFVTMNVGPFSFLSLCFYVTMVHPWEWRRAAARLRR